MKEETKKYLNLLKILSVDMIDAAGAGYPGISLGASSIIYTLFTEHLNIMPTSPQWLNRDRLVLSAAHATGLVYANMYMAGFDITLEDLKLGRKKTIVRYLKNVGDSQILFAMYQQNGYNIEYTFEDDEKGTKDYISGILLPAKSVKVTMNITPLMEDSKSTITLYIAGRQFSQNT